MTRYAFTYTVQLFADGETLDEAQARVDEQINDINQLYDAVFSETPEDIEEEED